jgi:hypothetical protein
MVNVACKYGHAYAGFGVGELPARGQITRHCLIPTTSIVNLMAPVQLYIYDLTRGMAAQLSRQLTGRYIEGVW